MQAKFCTVLGGFLLASALGAPVAMSMEIPAGSPIETELRSAESAAAAIVAVPDEKRTWENTIGALDDLTTRLENGTNMLRFLQYVSTDAAERERSAKAEEDAQNWYTEFWKRADIYQAVQGFAAKQFKLEGVQKRYFERVQRDFRRAGMALTPEKRAELKKLEMEITRLSLEFEKNIRDDETRVPLSPEELKGVDADVLARQPNAGGLLLIGMDYPTFNAVMQSCDSEASRQKVWVAYKRRGGHKNVVLIEKIIALRTQAAQLLGYATPADYEIEVRMAHDPAAVRKFFDDLRPKVRVKAQADYNEYQDAKRKQTGDAKAVLNPWDTMYYERVLQRDKYAVDAKKVQEYFPMERVVDGLFKTTQALYGIEYKDVTPRAGTKDRPLWHPDAKLYEVWDKASNKLLGEFYIDLYPRDNKYTHAAQWALNVRKRYMDGSTTTPLAALVCNFTKPTADKPSLLTHEEVSTFFHEFGHCLHTILTEVELGNFAGTNVARDFVEAPSQMFEEWTWNADVLNTFAKHYKIGEPLPKELLDGMIRARFLGSGLAAERQFYFGLTDLTFHSAKDGKVDTVKVAHDLDTQIELYPPIDGIFFHASFGHLVGYQAGYYGYMWSLVYASDMFGRFREQGLLNPQAGQYYRKKILARGDSLEAMDLVKDYLGREPKMDAFLEHLGLGAK